MEERRKQRNLALLANSRRVRVRNRILRACGLEYTSIRPQIAFLSAKHIYSTLKPKVDFHAHCQCSLQNTCQHNTQNSTHPRLHPKMQPWHPLGRHGAVQFLTTMSTLLTLQEGIFARMFHVLSLGLFRRRVPILQDALTC